MKRVLVFLVAFAACLVSAEWDLEREESMVKKCVEDLEIPGGIEALSDLNVKGVDDEKFRCFASCMGQAEGVLEGDDDDYVPEAGKEYLDNLFGKLKEDGGTFNEEEIRPALEECFKTASGEAKCEKAFNMYLCIYEVCEKIKSESGEEDSTA